MSALARLAVARPRHVLTAWFVITGLLGFVGNGVEKDLHRSNITVPGTASARADKLARERFGPGLDTVIVLQGPRAALDRQGRFLVSRMRRETQVSVLSPWTSVTGRALRPALDKALIVVRSEREFEPTSRELVPKLRADLRAGVRSPVQAHMSGYADISNGIHSGSVKATRTAGFIAIPLLLIILLAVFRSPLAAALPLVIGFSTVGAAKGVLAITNHWQNLDALALNFATLMSLALGVDYSLLVVSRFREERDSGADPEQALLAAIATAGRTVVFAGIAVVVSILAAIAVAPGTLLVSSGYGALIGIVLSVLSALTALPAILALLGAKLDRRTIGSPRAGNSRLGKLALRVLRRPAVASVLVLLLLATLCAPALGLKTGPPDPRGLAPGSLERIDYQAVRSALDPGWVAPYQVVIATRRGPITEPARLAAITRFERQMRARSDVRAVLGPGALGQLSGRLGARTRRLPAGASIGSALSSGYFLLALLDRAPPMLRNTAAFALNLDRGGTAAQIVVVGTGNAQEAGHPLRRVLERAMGPLSRETGSIADVGGVAPGLQDFDTTTTDRLPLLILLLAVVTYLVLVVVLRSVLLPLLAVVLNVLTVGAGLGVLVLLFQGHAVLGGPGFLDAITTFGIYAVMFALSIDYEVFLLTRLTEGYERTKSTEGAIEYAVQRTAGVITGAALIMTGVFVAFALTDITTTRQLGIGLAVAVLLDATLVRLVLLPGAIRLCGNACWWLPRPLRRILPAPAEETARA